MSRLSSDGSESGSGHESDSGESALQDEGEELASDKHGPPVDFCKLDKFYSSRKRLMLLRRSWCWCFRPHTVQMYFHELPGHGKLDKNSVKKLRLKYYLGGKGYKALAPPTLSNTKLHMIQTHLF